MNDLPNMPDDVIFWIHGPGETLVPLSLEELKAQLDGNEVPPDLPVYAPTLGQWLPLKSLFVEVTPPVVPNVQANFFAEHGSNDRCGAKAESARHPVGYPPLSVHPLRTSDFATRLIAMAVGVYVFGALASELLRLESKVFEIVIRIVPGVLMLIVCGLCLTGPIYFARRGKDGKPRKWHVANKAAAIMLGLASISCVGRGVLNFAESPTRPGEPGSSNDRATILDAEKMIRSQSRERTSRPVDTLNLHETDDGNFAGEMSVGSLVYDIRVKVDGLHMDWTASLRKAKAPEPFPVGPGEPSVVRLLTEKWGHSMMKRDYATLADLTWPATVKAAGGREAFIRSLHAMEKQMKEKGIKFEAFEAGEPKNMITVGSNTFSAMPTRTWLRDTSDRYVGESFALGVSSDGGKTWTFVDGAALSKEDERDAFVPKIPAALVFPRHKKAVLVED